MSETTGNTDEREAVARAFRSLIEAPEPPTISVELAVADAALSALAPIRAAEILAAERERDALREALRPFADMLDALENLGGMAKTGAWYIAESSVSGPREITFEHFHAARAALTANHSAPQEQQP